MSVQVNFDEAFTGLAKDDVSGQFLWFSKRSEELALKFLDSVQTTFEKIVEQPDGGMIWDDEERTGRPSSVRYRMVDDFPNHVMIYSTKPDCVRILRVFHAARKITASMILEE